MPRVLVTGFCAVPGPRRAGVQLRQVIRALTPNHTVDLLVVREGEQAYVERQGPVRVLRVPTHEAELKSQIQAFQRALKRQLEGADYEIVHCRDSWSAVPVIEARARLDHAVVYDLTRSPLGETTFDPALDAQYLREEAACLRSADLVLAPSSAAVQALRRADAPDRVMLSPPGVDVDRFDWDEVSPTGPPKILYAGSLDPSRGVRVAVRAMAAVVNEIDARLLLVGPMAPSFEPALRETIRELGLESKVELVPPVDHDQVPALIASATICIAPSAADVVGGANALFPTKLLEYMACRRPIVVARRDAMNGVVEDGREALFCAPGDPIDLADKLRRLLRDPTLRARLAAFAYERVRRDFTASAARRAIRHAYDLLSKRFASHFASHFERSSPPPVAPKLEIIDDDYEATVFEESAPSLDTAVNKVPSLADTLATLDDESTGSTSSGQVLASGSPSEPAEETIDGVAPVPVDMNRPWTLSGLVAPPPPPHDDWVVTNVGSAVRALYLPEAVAEAANQDDGTPIEGVLAAAPPLPVGGSNFVAGEIDVPTPSPERREQGASDPDTGSRTPPIERR